MCTKWAQNKKTCHQATLASPAPAHYTRTNCPLQSSLHSHSPYTTSTINISISQEPTELWNAGPWLADNQSRDLNNQLWLVVYLIRSVPDNIHSIADCDEMYTVITISSLNTLDLLRGLSPRNRPIQEILIPDWLITSHVTQITSSDLLLTCVGRFLLSLLNSFIRDIIGRQATFVE